MSDHDKLMAARNNIYDAFGRSFALYGLPEVAGHIYGVLYFADRPLGLEDIAGELGVSKATVSINVRVLEAIKCVRRVWQKGSRRDYYEAERDFTRIFIEIMKSNIKKELEITNAAIDRSKELLTGIAGTPDEELREKVKADSKLISKLEKEYKWYGRLMEIFGAGEKVWNTVTFKKKGNNGDE
jgi:DNA-binding transcriptional regulator GbsR (MarR family)